MYIEFLYPTILLVPPSCSSLMVLISLLVNIHPHVEDQRCDNLVNV